MEYKEILNHIVINASTTKERYFQGFIPVNSEKNYKHIKSLADTWKKSVCGNTPEIFEFYLQQEGMEYEKYCLLLGETELPGNFILPPWADMLTEILLCYDNVSLSGNQFKKLTAYLESRDSIAFTELFLPIACLASNHLTEKLNTSTVLLSENAQFDLLYSLIKRISDTSTRVLETEFLLYRSRFRTSLERLILGNTSTTLYDSFIESMLKEGLLDLFMQYPVLARLLATVLMQWLASTGELIARLEKDYFEISNIFNYSKEAGKISEIQCDLSDRHNGGKTVTIISFDSGFRLVYKPRSLDMEDIWFRLLSYLNGEMSDELFKCVKILNKQSYGWMEYVEHIPCMDELDVKLYYKRAGALLCMVYLLGGTDCHHENLIACGSYPVLIDMETLFSPSTNEFSHKDVFESTEDMERNNSVMRTGLLPEYRYAQDEKKYDLSGFGGGTGGDAYPRRMKWVDVNTDNMRLEYIKHEVLFPANLPYMCKTVYPADIFTGEVINGFEALLALIQKNKKKLSQYFQKFFSGRICRYIHRSTLYYDTLIKKSLKPEYMRNSIERDILFSSLYAGITNISSYPSYEWSLCKAEIQCLEVTDIPYFYIENNSLMKHDSDILVKDFCAAKNTSYPEIQLHLLNIANTKAQTNYIKSAFR
ncbi:MAG: type 2 lanthipeptide synthetase LanM family protein [Clostridia bacterium]|nr:type 2 lanthipeptide synthetase LanM family protein [Clostridia bacterium]